MKKSLIFILLVSFTLLDCGTSISSGTIAPDKFKEAIDSMSGLQILDVRTPEEFISGHIEGARNLDFFAPNFQSELSKLDQNKPIAVYCAVGSRSVSTLKMLQSLGFQKIYDLERGILNWQKYGFEVTKN